MIILRQYTTPTCVICKQHKPMLVEIENEYEGEIKLEFVNINSLAPEEARTIGSVPLYKILSDNGKLLEVWSGTKSKSNIIDLIESVIE